MIKSRACEVYGHAWETEGFEHDVDGEFLVIRCVRCGRRVRTVERT